MLAVGLAKQVQVMHFEKKLDPQQIADSLKLDIGDVTQALLVTPESRKSCKTKELLARHIERAVEVTAEVMEDYANPHLQLAAAKFIQEVDLGKYDRPELGNAAGAGLTPVQFNIIVNQGNQAYEDALRRAGIINDPIDVESVVTPKLNHAH